jgi:hypothetical protein
MGNRCWLCSNNRACPLQKRFRTSTHFRPMESNRSSLVRAVHPTQINQQPPVISNRTVALDSSSRLCPRSMTIPVCWVILMRTLTFRITATLVASNVDLVSYPRTKQNSCVKTLVAALVSCTLPVLSNFDCSLFDYNVEKIDCVVSVVTRKMVEYSCSFNTPWGLGLQ